MFQKILRCIYYFKIIFTFRQGVWSHLFFTKYLEKPEKKYTSIDRGAAITIESQHSRPVIKDTLHRLPLPEMKKCWAAYKVSVKIQRLHNNQPLQRKGVDGDVVHCSLNLNSLKLSILLQVLLLV